ncbi:hypothetical protein PPROV_000906100 [Pycnococcus provasolii]|uniref:Uncharacterized protein n=1 Tax=Pycnococcus provasolii TaxID=41880 RepID=A0A830HWZ6_9CHLO|nr:hypothetical protein PPROV_000906100 [Pycnococcus provasolii]
MESLFSSLSLLESRLDALEEGAASTASRPLAATSSNANARARAASTPPPREAQTHLPAARARVSPACRNDALGRGRVDWRDEGAAVPAPTWKAAAGGGSLSLDAHDDSPRVRRPHTAGFPPRNSRTTAGDVRAARLLSSLEKSFAAASAASSACYRVDLQPSSSSGRGTQSKATTALVPWGEGMEPELSLRLVPVRKARRRSKRRPLPPPSTYPPRPMSAPHARQSTTTPTRHTYILDEHQNAPQPDDTQQQDDDDVPKDDELEHHAEVAAAAATTTTMTSSSSTTWKRSDLPGGGGGCGGGDGSDFDVARSRFLIGQLHPPNDAPIVANTAAARTRLASARARRREVEDSLFAVPTASDPEVRRHLRELTDVALERRAIDAARLQADVASVSLFYAKQIQDKRREAAAQKMQRARQSANRSTRRQQRSAD